MSGDEVLVFIVCCVIGLATVYQLLGTPFAVKSWNVSGAPVLRCIWSAVAAMLALLVVLHRWSSFDVRDSALYTVFYLVMGLAWIGLTLAAWSLFGLSFRDDVIERGNSAGATALGGVIVGATLAYSGANIGDGPGWWVVVFCAALSTGTLLIGWLILQVLGRVADRITIERDVSTGWHIAGLFIACGLITGRAAAGNWTSAEAAVVDFARLGSPSLLLFLFAGYVERVSRIVTPGGELAMGRAWVLPLLYVAVALFLVGGAGPW